MHLQQKIMRSLEKLKNQRFYQMMNFWRIFFWIKVEWTFNLFLMNNEKLWISATTSIYLRHWEMPCRTHSCGLFTLVFGLLVSILSFILWQIIFISFHNKLECFFLFLACPISQPAFLLIYFSFDDLTRNGYRRNRSWHDIWNYFNLVLDDIRTHDLSIMSQVH